MTRPVAVGDVELHPLVDAVGALGELAELFPGVPAEDWDPYRELHPGLFAGSRWRAPCTCYLLRSPGHIVLVDTGVGPAGLWAWEAEREEGLLPALAAAGTRPEDVDLVFLTHLHIDHVGWNTDGDGNLVFPRARYVTHRDGVAFALQSGRPHVERCIRAVVEAGVLDELGGKAELAPGLTAVSLAGHYPGHMGVHVESGLGSAMLIADTAVHPLLLDRPDVAYVSDIDAEETIATRHEVLPGLVDAETLVVCGHYPDGGIGRLTRRDGRVVWEAVG
ncbi:MAG TPA: MBL fold metallo-hydrolase [Gaiellaceae bacterium]|nr:MBL fold metallo-hydrolase [Gaiellaceae bacterium]